MFHLSHIILMPLLTIPQLILQALNLFFFILQLFSCSYFQIFLVILQPPLSFFSFLVHTEFKLFLLKLVETAKLG